MAEARFASRAHECAPVARRRLAAGRAARGDLRAAGRAAGSARAGSDARAAAAVLDAGRRARLLARHRQPRPRPAVAADLWRAHRLHRRLRRGHRRLPRRLGARPDRRLFRRLGRPHRLAHRRHLDGVSAGAVRDPAGRGARHRPQLGHHRHRRHRLDAVLPRGARRGDEPGAHGLCRERPHRRLRPLRHHAARSPAQRAARRSSRCCRWKWASR